MAQGSVDDCTACHRFCFRRRTVNTLTAIVLVVMTLLGLVLVNTWNDAILLRQKVSDWNGFSPEERGTYNFTVVTTLMDIGRGSWFWQSRSYETYLLDMSQVLMMDVNMVIFIEEKGKHFVERIRRNRESRTVIIPISIEQFPLYTYRQKIDTILKSESYLKGNANSFMNYYIEAWNAVYDILVLSKLHLMNKAIQLNRFNNSYFLWLDGGYGHGGSGLFPRNGVWNPCVMTSKLDKIFILAVSDLEQYANTVDLYKMRIDAMAAGAFGGGVEVLQRYSALQDRVVMDWLNNSIFDDEQAAGLVLYFRNRTMFHVVQAGWFDIFKVTGAII